MNAAPELRLRYFPFPGRAGPIRDALRIGGIGFEDQHVSLEDFTALKAADALPFGALPVLEVSTPHGRVSAAQSNAILRYVGRRCGLYPVDDALLALKVDEALDLGEDFYGLFTPSFGESDPGRLAQMRRELAEQTLPRWGGYFERLLLANGDTGFVAGDTLTVADLKLHWVIDKLTNGTLDGVPADWIDPFAAVGRWRANVAAVRSARLAT